MGNNLCTALKPFKDVPCSPSLSQSKTVYIDASAADKYKDMIDRAKRDGTPMVIEAEDLADPEMVKLLEAQIKTAGCIKPVHISNNCDVPKLKTILTDKTPFKPSNRDLQAKELATATIPDDTKKKIAAEYWRLCKRHPTWKAHRAMRKAGEKFNIKFELE